jgi:1-aminocyclopropane-1-carboxylate deaminase
VSVPALSGLGLRLPSPVEVVQDERLSRRRVRLLLKRDDLISAEVPGNKWRKLKYNLVDARAAGHRTLLTFGGAYSNHIRAVAAAGHRLGFATVGVIRGEEHRPLNPVLDFAVNRGMRLTYLDRTSYRAKDGAQVLDGLHRRFGEFFLIPEGGSNAAAVRGAAEVPQELLPDDYDVICCPVGTGGTLAGLAAGLPAGKQALGFAALKGGGFLCDEVRRLQREYGVVTDNWAIELGYHGGGYARRSAALDGFIEDFRRRHCWEPEWVYVAKMLYGVFDLIGRGRFAPGTTIVAVVTGPATPSARTS